MRTILFLSFLIISITVFAQDKYITRTGHISFFSEAPMENIEAHNHQVTSILNTASGDMVFSMLMKGFEFEKALMQEHFNESYVESEKFPKSTFKGVIQNFDAIDLSKNGEYDVVVKGQLEIHGESKEYSINGKLIREGNKIKGNSKFNVKVADHGIKIPAGKVNNIAEVVEVTVDISYEPYGK